MLDAEERQMPCRLGGGGEGEINQIVIGWIFRFGVWEMKYMPDSDIGHFIQSTFHKLYGELLERHLLLFCELSCMRIWGIRTGEV
jgi:hypothetical protein